MSRYASISLLVLTMVISSINAVPSRINIVDKETVSEFPSVIPAFEKIDISRLASHPSAINLYSVKKGQLNHGGVMLLKNVEFGVTGASKIMVGVHLERDVKEKLEIRLDSENGKLISTLPLTKVGSEPTRVINGSVEPVKGYHDLYVSYSGQVQPKNISWFQFEVAGPNPEEFYVMTSVWDGKALSANTPNKVVKEHTRTYPYSYGLHQMFSFEKTVFGSYRIKSRHSGMYLEVRDFLFTESNPVHLNIYNATTQAQEWYMDSTGQGSVKIMSRLSGRCLSIHNTNFHMYQLACLNAAYQQWFLMPVC